METDAGFWFPFSIFLCFCSLFTIRWKLVYFRCVSPVFGSRWPTLGCFELEHFFLFYKKKRNKKSQNSAIERRCITKKNKRNGNAKTSFFFK